ncbi:MAG: hypothetical protein JO039_06740 [Solirubrobacterales bacterium]|nr:hypothetical protein [Solirubrobacterales bacterium]
MNLLEKEEGMNINAAVVDLPMSADPTPTQRAHKIIALVRPLVGRRRWPQERSCLTIGDARRIPDGRRGHERGSNWVHTHH